MKNFMPCIFYVCVMVWVSCASDAVSIKEGCINKNTLRIVVFISDTEITSRKLRKDDITKEALHIAEKRCKSIIADACVLNNKSFAEPKDYLISKIVAVEKRPHGYYVLVDYTISDDIASLLECK